MNVLIYDVDCESSGIEYPIKLAFENNGHKADMFDWRKYLYSYTNDSLKNRLKDRFLFNLIASQINRDLRKIIHDGKYDLFLVIRGDHIFPETILYAKMFIHKVVNWNSDHLFNELNSTKYIIDSFDKYDIHFSPRPHLREEYLARGAKSFETLHWYYRTGLLYPPPNFECIKYAADISFVGSWSKRRQSFLTELNDLELKLYGWGWCNKMSTEKYKNWLFNKSVRIDDMMMIFSTTKVNINILTIENMDSSNFRNYEIPAAGGFQLAERSECILELFEEDKEIVCFGSPEELKSKCDFYSRNNLAREKIALAGYNRLINGHNSLSDRVQQIIYVIEH